MTVTTTGAAALETHQLTVRFGRGSSSMTALDGVSVAVPRERTVGLVGESGSGKSTWAKAVLGILPVSHGTILHDGQDVTRRSAAERRRFWRTVQMIPQDPYSSLNPRRTIGQILAEAINPMRVEVGRHRDTIAEHLEAVRLPADSMSRYPHEFSGGQRQRIAIARALIVRPSVIIADEITSALDVSVQAEVLDVLDKLRRELKLTIVFISHNLAVVRAVSDDVVVLYHGHVVENGAVDEVFANPQHPYTQQLLRAVPGSPGFSLEPQSDGGPGGNS